MRNPSPYLTALLLAASLPLLAVEDAKTVIQFDRPIAQGSSFDCEIEAAHSKSFSMSMPGVETPLIKGDVALAKLSGRMTVLEVNPSGNPLKIRFQTKSLDGAIDRIKPDLAALQGKAFTADLTPPVCKFAMEDDDQAPMTKEAVKLLSIIFRPSSKSGIGDLMGTKEAVKPGDSWKPPCSLLISMLAQRGLKFNEGNFRGAVTLKGRTSMASIDCWQLEERIETTGTPGFDLRIDISILLPVDPAKGGALKLSRNGQEMVCKTLPEGNPLSAGKTVEAIVKDSMDAVIIPVQ